MRSARPRSQAPGVFSGQTSKRSNGEPTYLVDELRRVARCVSTEAWP